MDMVAEAKKRVEEDWYFHRLPILGIQSDTIRYTNEDGVKGLLLAEVVGDTPAARFIANTPAFIVAQDERIQRLEKVVEATRQLLEKKFALDGGYYFMDGNGQEPQLHLMEVLKAYDLEESA